MWDDPEEGSVPTEKEELTTGKGLSTVYEVRITPPLRGSR